MLSHAPSPWLFLFSSSTLRNLRAWNFMVWPAPGFDFVVFCVVWHVEVSGCAAWAEWWHCCVRGRYYWCLCITGPEDFTKAGRAGALESKLARSEEHVSKTRSWEYNTMSRPLQELPKLGCEPLSRKRKIKEVSSIIIIFFLNNFSIKLSSVLKKKRKY